MFIKFTMCIAQNNHEHDSVGVLLPDMPRNCQTAQFGDKLNLSSYNPMTKLGVSQQSGWPPLSVTDGFTRRSNWTMKICNLFKVQERNFNS